MSEFIELTQAEVDDLKRGMDDRELSRFDYALKGADPTFPKYVEELKQRAALARVRGERPPLAEAIAALKAHVAAHPADDQDY